MHTTIMQRYIKIKHLLILSWIRQLSKIQDIDKIKIENSNYTTVPSHFKEKYFLVLQQITFSLH